MTNTVVKCPNCAGATHAVSIAADALVSDKQYLLLTCANCMSQLMFVVDLLPGFERCVDTLRDTRDA